MTTLAHRFPDTVFRALRPPGQHPTYKYAGFAPSVQTLPKGHTRAPGRRPFGVATVFERDVGVALRDGMVVYADVFRPAFSGDEGKGEGGRERVPAVVAWSPYGKSGDGCMDYDNMGPFRMGIPLERTSGYEKFEAPDPAEWAERGYAVVNVDPRGAGASEGDLVFWGQQEAEDMYDFVDWVAAQAWCNGAVAFAGNSWLAIAQINFASRFKHPAVKALAPWEALTDVYRQMLVRGGIPRLEFTEMIIESLAGHGRVEDLVAMYHKHPIYDEYWKDKTIEVENIDVPLYLTASYSTGLHSEGSFHTFMKAKSPQKWLRVHASQEWHDLYRPEANDELQQFFDRYCKNLDNGWEKTPRFRISLLGFTGSPAKSIIEKPEAAWPIPRTKYLKLYLDSATKILVPSAPTQEAIASYTTTSPLNFTHTFSTHTELAGYPSITLYLSTPTPTPTALDTHIQVRKRSRTGDLLASLNYPCPVPEPAVPDTNVAKFLGSDGMLRASCMGTKKELEDGRVWYALDEPGKPVPRDEVVRVEIPVWPLGVVFERGEGVVVRVSAVGGRLPEVEALRGGAEGVGGGGERVDVHTGGRWEGVVVLPVIS